MHSIFIQSVTVGSTPDKHWWHSISAPTKRNARTLQGERLPHRPLLPIERAGETMAVLFNAPMGEGIVAGLLHKAARALGGFLERWLRASALYRAGNGVTRPQTNHARNHSH